MSRTRRMALPLAVGLTCVGLLAGCSSGGEPKTDETSPTPTMSAQPDDKLADALTSLLIQEDLDDAPDGLGDCLVKTVREGGISPEGEKALVETEAEGWAEAIGELENDDRNSLGEVSKEIDGCVIGAFHVDAQTKEKVVEPMGVTPKTGKQNTKMKYKQDKKDDITSTDQLTPGLISMFTSFNPASKEMVKDSTPCMSEVILAEEFSDKTLRLLAGGAPLGTGSVADAIAGKDKTDAKTWTSRSFQAALSDCTTSSAQETTEEAGDQ